MISTSSVKSNTAFGPRLYKLPAVKECLYHPQLPTFRRMDIDTAAHKLPDEHCRTTTRCKNDNFRSATITLYRPAEKPLNCTNFMENNGPLSSLSNSHIIPLNQNGPLLECNEVAKADIEGTLPFSGYTMRYLSPVVTASWKYSLRQEPFIDQHGQRPVPANIFSRHRTLSPSYRVSTAAWRP
ncbi:testis, prostate and placenta-expressed protein-like [Hydractinia symbiolongicarpus]|uniref:testis, prostate and placenta-expressed protein-like n=1 Tax=Hydractinia symbiolongicarpus TaxID=13093 RepID=UPI0025510E11|nr:testis, prostate and placenta-expressed protein-like [Hydractinia symbiolongicarpus]